MTEGVYTYDVSLDVKKVTVTRIYIIDLLESVNVDLVDARGAIENGGTEINTYTGISNIAGIVDNGSYGLHKLVDKITWSVMSKI